MIKFFEYCFYRTAKCYENWGEKDGHIAGGVVTFMSIGAIALSILIFGLYLFGKKMNVNIVWVVVVITSILSFFLTKKKYAELAEKYKDEKNSKIKGWLVFSYVVGSVVLFFVSMFACGYWVSVKI
ncbi:MAG: hypothetical protein LBK94_07440 [Prevotellaceae bacterium]|jgi:uncharacterized membrane protein YdjX (TVP38/TMEM64 family)|nr:hypothetical protein [Prevotellaceae bacterium]